MPETEWDEEALDRRFRSAAKDAQVYLTQCRGLVADNPSYERMIDEHTARWEANDYFAGRTFTQSRQKMLNELAAIRDRDHRPGGVYDLERYQLFWRSEIDALVAKFTTEK